MDNYTSRFLKGGYYVFSASLIIVLLTIVYSVLSARMLGKENLGILTILINLQSIVFLVAVFGIPAASVKYIAEYNVTNEKSLEKLISTGLSLLLVSSLLSISIYFLSAKFFVKLYNEPVLFYLIIISSITVFFLSFFQLFKAVLQGFQEIKILSRLNILTSVIAIPILIFFVSYFGLIGAALTVLMQTIIITGISYIYIKRLFDIRNIRITLCINKDIFKKLLNYSFPTLLSGFLLTPTILFANTLLSARSGFGAVGLFSVAYSFVIPISLVSAAVSVPLVPLISELHSNNYRRMTEMVSNTFRLEFFIILPLSIIIILSSQIIVPYIYGQQYYDSLYVLFFMVISYFLIALGSFIGYVLAGTGKMWESFSINFCWTIIFIPLSYVLIKLFGLNGLGYAYFISYSLFLILLLIFSKFKLNIMFKNINYMAFLAAVSFSVSFILINLEIKNYVTYIFYSLLIILALLIGEYKLLSEDERNLFRGIYNRGVRLL